MRLIAGLAVVAAGLFVPGISQAGPGSLIDGVVWADTNRDGVHQPDEVAYEGVTVELLDAGGAVVATTTTVAGGAYSFADASDGAYTVRVSAPGAFAFPDAVGADNDFVSTGPPQPGDPERGVSAAITVEGNTQATGLDAGMQPIADLVVARLEQPDSCEGFASTGTPPFDAEAGPGNDTGPENCVIRTNDTVTQNYSVSLTGLPTGAEVDNVIAEFTVSSPDGATLELAGPGAQGMPAGCLAAAQGADPPSSVTTNPDGSITVTCNIGTMSSNVAALTFAYRVGGDSAVPSHASVEMRAYAAQGDAGVSNSVEGPVVEITGSAQWELIKESYPNNQFHGDDAGPNFAQRTIDGQVVDGYLVTYQFTIEDTSEGGTGGSELDWPVTFTDSMPGFPNARIVECRQTNLSDAALRSPWTLTCPDEPQGDDGWELSIEPNSGNGLDTYPTGSGSTTRTGIGFVVMQVFIPVEDMNRAVDPSWQPGQDFPTGTANLRNEARDTDTWTMRGGQPNHGDGFEPGWDGNEATGDNLVERQIEAAPPEWDLQKARNSGPAFQTREIDGEEVDGYWIRYLIDIEDLAGPDNVAPWLDWPVTFTDRLVEYPDAHLLACYPWGDNRNRTNGTPTCDTGVQGDDGWEMSWTPNVWGLNIRLGRFYVEVFIPAEGIHPNPCQADPAATFAATNEAINSEHWTIAGQPNNGTGFEPGWDGETATGNNVVSADYIIRPNDSICVGNPIVDGQKQFLNWPGEPGINPLVASKIGGSQVWVRTNGDAVVENPMLCDVFDVSVVRIVDDHPLGPGGWTDMDGIVRMFFGNAGGLEPDDFVVEYAVGPNANDTQAGPLDGSGRFPADVDPNRDATEGCPDDAGPWETDPTVFGTDWQDRVNIVRVRPVDPTTILPESSQLNFTFPFEVRGIYNGGPNDGEQIPGTVWFYNHGGRTGIVVSGGQIVDQNWVTSEARLPTAPMSLAIAKTTSPTQYLPGSDVVWDIHLRIDNAALGATMQNLQVVDTLPDDVLYDAACTQDRLPDGVTAAYNPATRQATFSLGDIEIVSSPTQWVSHPINAPDGLLQICATIDGLAQPGDTFVNRVQASADNSENSPTAQHAVQAVGAGQMGISKGVDKPFVASGESYIWSLEWGNTSTTLAFQNPDIIDVLPWNGDADAGSDSQRDQYRSEYTGLAELTGPLPQPTYVRGGTGVGDDVAGTWYYSTVDPSTIDHDPRDASNANPGAPGGLWLTEAEIAAGDGFGAVTAIRFVSDGFLTSATRVEAVIPAVSTSTDLDNVYVNRAMMFSGTFADQPLLSNEPYVLMPGFSLGDLVWRDDNGDGVFNGDEQGIPDVVVEVLDQNGAVIATRTTDGAGRWFVDAIPAGTYSVRIPAVMFQAGGPLENYSVVTAGASDANDGNEGVNNNNTAAADPAVTGLTSSPVTLEYVYEDDQLVGANGPLADNVAALGDPIIPDEFTNFTIDLALAPVPDVDIEKATNGVDADAAPGPSIALGDPVVWTYEVTNTGLTDLSNVTVTDDVVDASEIDCGDGTNVVAGPLAPDESFTCTAQGTAIEGHYANTGSVVGDAPDASQVTDNDPSHYFGEGPDIDIEKATNGVDADEPPGVYIRVGDPVTWTFVVTNTGAVDLVDVVVTDDVLDESAIDCGSGSNRVAGPLAPGASFTCTAQGTAVAGQHANTASGRATAPDEREVTDDDPSHYFGASPAVDIEKATNGQDADAAPGPYIEMGDPVEWTYVVTNTGDVDLSDVTITDDQVGAAEIDCGSGRNVVAGPLAPGASFTCTATGTAVGVPYQNTGFVVADSPDGSRVSDDDPSHYLGGVTDDVGDNLPPPPEPPGQSPPAPNPPSGTTTPTTPTTTSPTTSPPPTGFLPATGGSGAPVIPIATGLLIAGAALATLRSRRRPHTDPDNTAT